MGNNAAFTVFERAVIRAYNQGRLTLEELDSLAELFRGTDIDTGGSEDLETKEGKSIIVVVVETVAPEWKPTKEDLLPFEQEKEDWESYARFRKWSEITRTRWGWW